MALFNGAINILRQTVINKSMPVATLPIYQTIRCASNWKLFVGGVAPDTNDTRLREVFSKHGEVTEAKVIMDEKTGKSSGIGFVTFAKYEPACRAINTMDQWELHGQTVTVRWAKDSGGDIELSCLAGEELAGKTVYFKPTG
ncbi:hypothetical protein QVD17_29441 [Tagetes erecta]|uniref:RRM domain-containing protein n=1 Tax=Tagetes erecta TaxID=13708 RepID=A0AAD8NTE2_TARER|nr:hypothetical protein QVD17_29441 [Tagetes erecta]